MANVIATVRGKAVRGARFSSAAAAKAWAGRGEWVVAGEGAFFVVRPVDAARLEGHGFQIVL